MKRLICALLLGALALGYAGHAQAVTTPGSNFDGIMSLIYDSTTGNMFVENAPLPNPAVQQISIAPPVSIPIFIERLSHGCH